MPLPAPLEGLLRPEAWPHPVHDVHLVETYISWVLLTGDWAYKVKRPVRLDFIDFGTPERREFFCREEVRLNRRFAPELYLDVVPVLATAGGPRVGTADDRPDGPVVEHAVRMRQFPASAELHAQLDAGAVDDEDFRRLGQRVAAAHGREAPRTPDGGAAGVVAVLRDNATQCRNAVRALGADDARDVAAALRDRAAAAGPVIAARIAAGAVRDGHGDLHVSNIVRWGDALLPFDCLEFEPRFRVIDAAQDLAFLYMDLEAQGHVSAAAAFLDGAFAESGDYGACQVLPLYAAHYALVRAKVKAINAALAAEPAGRADLAARARLFLGTARRWLAPRTPRLVAVGGVSGSGKTWLARRLAGTLPAVHLRSDVERKRLAGLPAEARTGSLPGGGLYTADRTARVYERLAALAGEVLAGGMDCIVDATCLTRAQRAAFPALAARAGARFAGLWCEAPPAVLAERLRRRAAAASDPSEADAAVLALQRSRVEPPAGEAGWTVLDTAADDAPARAEALLGAAGG